MVELSGREIEKESEEADSGLSRRRPHGEDSLDKALSALALGAEADLSPENGRPDCALGLVVGGVNTFPNGERPQALPEAAKLLGQRPGFRILALQGVVDQPGISRLHHPDLQSVRRFAERSLPMLTMCSEHPLRLGHTTCTQQLGLGLLPLGDRLPVPQKMRMAEPPLLERLVHMPAVGNHHAWIIIRQQLTSRLVSTPLCQLEYRPSSVGHHPDPASFAPVSPTGLVRMRYAIGQDHFLDLLIRPFQHSSGGLAESLHRPQPQLKPERVCQEFGHASPAHPVTPAEQGDHRDHPRAEGTRWYAHRHRSQHGTAARTTAKAMAAVFGDDWANRRNLRDLLADRRSDLGLLTAEGGFAMRAACRKVIPHDVRHRDRTMVASMAGLATGLLSRRLLRGGLRRAGRIGGRRDVGVAGVPVEASFQILDTGQQNLHRLLQDGDRRITFGDGLLKFRNTLFFGTLHATSRSHRRPPVDGRLLRPRERVHGRYDVASHQRCGRTYTPPS